MERARNKIAKKTTKFITNIHYDFEEIAKIKKTMDSHMSKTSVFEHSQELEILEAIKRLV